MDDREIMISRRDRWSKPQEDRFNLKDSEFEKILWVLKARSKDPNKEVLQKVLVQDRYMICSDEARLHLCKADYPELPDGVYKVRKATKDFVFLRKGYDKYPDVWKMFEKKTFHPLIKGLECNGDKTPFVRSIYNKSAAYYNVDCLIDMYIDNAPVNIEEGEFGSRGSKILVFGDGDRMAALVSMIYVTKLEKAYELWR